MRVRGAVAVGAVTGVLLGALVGNAGTSGAGFVDEGFYVNENSFIPEGLEGSVSRIAQFSAQVWARTGASRFHLKFLGLGNSMTGCGVGVPNHIFGSMGCDPTDAVPCTTAAVFSPPYPSCFYSWNVTYWLNSCDFRMDPISDVPRAGQVLLDGGPAKVAHFAAILQHEVGHRFTDHLPDQNGQHPEPFTCIMNAGFTLVTGTRVLDNPCNLEIETIGGNVGHPRDIVREMESTQFPVPNSSWLVPSQVAPKFGNGFAAVLPGPANSFAYADSSVSPHRVKTVDYNRGNPNGVEWAAPFFTNRVPAVAYDPTIGQWWYFASDPTDNVTVNVFSTTNRIAFTNRGKVQHAFADAQIKSTPGVAYDPRTHRIVVVWSRSDNSQLAPSCNWFHCQPTCEPGGCVNELVVASFDATAGGALTWAGAFPFRGVVGRGHSGIGTPAVACDSSNVAGEGNCMVMTNGRDPGRNLFDWTFRLDLSGNLTFFSPTAHSFFPSAIDMTPSIAASNPLGTGAFVLVARGTDSNVYFNSRTTLASGWNGWVNIPGVATHYNPQIAVRGNAYHLLVAP